MLQSNKHISKVSIFLYLSRDSFRIEAHYAPATARLIKMNVRSQMTAEVQNTNDETPRFRRLTGRLGTAFASFQRSLAEESFAALDDFDEQRRSRNNSINDYSFTDSHASSNAIIFSGHSSDILFFKPNHVTTTRGRRRVLARDDSYIRRSSSLSEDNSFVTNSNWPQTSSNNNEEKDIDPDRPQNHRVSVNDVDQQPVAADVRTCSSGAFGNTALKVRALERARARFMLTRDDSYINRSNVVDMEPFQVSLSDGLDLLRRQRRTSNSNNNSKSISSTSWPRPSPHLHAESWGDAKTMNLQSMASTRHVGASTSSGSHYVNKNLRGIIETEKMQQVNSFNTAA